MWPLENLKTIHVTDIVFLWGRVALDPSGALAYSLTPSPTRRENESTAGIKTYIPIATKWSRGS